MGTTGEYAELSVLLSFFSLVLSIAYLWRVIDVYRRFHDERAAVSLGKAVGLTVIATGMMVSSLGLVFHSPDLAVAGLSFARGALVVLLLTLVLANVRPGHRDSVGDTRSRGTRTRSGDD
jgi:multisubunit Na+/H+ antiporter MnhG subunit